MTRVDMTLVWSQCQVRGTSSSRPPQPDGDNQRNACGCCGVLRSPVWSRGERCNKRNYSYLLGWELELWSQCLRSSSTIKWNSLVKNCRAWEAAARVRPLGSPMLCLSADLGNIPGFYALADYVFLGDPVYGPRGGSPCLSSHHRISLDPCAHD